MDEISPLIIEKYICWNASTLMRNDQLWMDCMWHLGDSSFLMGSAQTEPRTWAKNFCVSARKWRRYLESIQIFIINYPSQVRKLFQLMSSRRYDISEVIIQKSPLIYWNNQLNLISAHLFWTFRLAFIYRNQFTRIFYFAI